MPTIVKQIVTSLCSILLINVACCIPLCTVAQSTGQLKREGDASFAKADYYNAIKMYSAILYDSPLVNKIPSLVYPFRPVNQLPKKIKATQKPLLQYQLAESYRLCYHYKEAVPQYEQYISSLDTRFPLARLWYGLCLLANDQPDKAILSLNAFLQKYKTVDSFAQKAKQAIVNSNFAMAQRSKKPGGIVTKLNSAVSADGSNFGLQKADDSSFLFTTSRHELDKNKEKIYPVRLYAGSLNKTEIKKIDGFPGSDINMATPSLSVDGLTLYFTGWKEDGTSKKTYYRIYYLTRKTVTDQWSSPVLLPVSVNREGFHAKQPFITRDNKHLLFVSDRPGGSGKNDIWIVEMNGHTPVSNAINAGSIVNTEGDEASPFYNAISGDLYFSSNGRIGMGGMDIYKIKGNLSSVQWTGTATNLGVPFNSVKDDDYFSKDANSDTAYLSSDRASTCCMEIFKVAPLPQRDTVVMYVNSPPKLIDTIYVVRDENKRLMDSVNEVTVDRMYVNYRFASTKIRKEDRPQLNRIVQMLKKDLKLNMLVASFTDCIGSESANTLISRKRSASVKAFLIENGIEPSRINVDFFGKKHFVLACKEDTSYNTEKQMANRRSDLIVTTEKNPKWIPSGKELDIEKGSTLYPQTPLHTVAVEKPAKLPIDSKQIGEVIIADKKITEEKREGKNEPVITADKKQNAVPAIISGIVKLEKTVDPKKETVNSNNKPVSKYRIPAVKSAIGMNSVKKSSTEEKEQLKTKYNLSLKSELTAKATPELYQKPVMAKPIDSAPKTLHIAELLDLTPRLKRPTVIEQMTSRTPKRSFEVYSMSDSVKVELYDNGVFDYDTVSVIYNKSLVVYKEMLRTNRPITFYVKLNTEPRKNEMIFFAENLGLTPPNSALMIITDGEKKRTEINVSSDLDHNSVIYFIKVNKNKK